MNQMPGSADRSEENPGVDGGTFDGSVAVEATDEFKVHLAVPDQEVDRLLPGTSDRQSDPLRQLEVFSPALGQPMTPPGDDDQSESLALAGRPDIDAAMVLALRSTMVTDQSSQGPAEATRDRDQLTLVGTSGNQSASTCGSPVLAGRPDIDAAMVLALRSASLTKEQFPILDHPAPGRNPVGTTNPPGEC